jgi:2-dehydro-3-deoxygalactonokinase
VDELIAVDWGTSNFRAFRLNAVGEIIERRSVAAGILSVQQGRFAEAIREYVRDWLAAGENRILLSGMVGSRNGWMEAPYLNCPAGIAEIADASIAIPFDGCDVRLIPGVKGTDRNGIHEVMRGEETEIIGMFDSLSWTANCTTFVCLPGTHSKWVEVKDQRIVSFQTCMTGEVFTALRKGTILGHTMSRENEIDKTAFLRGVARSKDAGGLLHHLFGVRSLYLIDLLKEEESASYLSGLLIGHEVRHMMSSSSKIHLSGAAQLSSLYSLAIDACGGTPFAEHADSSVRGHIAIARKLQWI